MLSVIRKRDKVKETCALDSMSWADTWKVDVGSERWLRCSEKLSSSTLSVNREACGEKYMNVQIWRRVVRETRDGQMNRGGWK